MKTGIICVLVWLAIMVAAVVGWVLNIVAIAQTTTFSGFVILRAIGVFIAPLGAILGWF